MTKQAEYMAVILAMNGQITRAMMRSIEDAEPVKKEYILSKVQDDLSFRLNKFLRNRDKITIELAQLMKLMKWHHHDPEERTPVLHLACQGNIYNLIRLLLLDPDRRFNVHFIERHKNEEYSYEGREFVE